MITEVEKALARIVHERVEQMIKRAHTDPDYNYSNEAIEHITVGLAVLKITKNLYLMTDMENVVQMYKKELLDAGCTLSPDESAALAEGTIGVGGTNGAKAH